MKELLSPAGDMECLKAAVNNGADAVYLAGKAFGARKFARNFNNEELKDAVNYAHLYGVKVYVTVNTIIYENEIKDCLEYINYLYIIGVDAVIVQDMGLITLIRKYFPDLDIHASTQAHTHNLEQIKLLENLGVKRVVLAREMSIKEINELDTNMELEIFIHGALCISYSGQCLFSSGVLGRSGNRGECAGLCRTSFKLVENNCGVGKEKYYLSPKEFNTTAYIEELKKSKAYSFKIEGRMKSPEYVGYVTSIYRKLLDNNNYKLSDEEIFHLKSLYNRGFTKGYLFSNTDQEFISLNSSNHQGVEIGKVIDYNHHKIKIKLDHDLYQGDAVRLPNGEGMYVNFLYDLKDNYINHANKGDIIYIDNKVNLQEKGHVLLTIDSNFVKELKQQDEKKILINCDIYAYINEPLRVSYQLDDIIVTYEGEVVSEAKTSPIKKERLEEIFTKLGNTPFLVNKLNSDISDNIFLAIGLLKDIKRNLLQDLINRRCEVKRKSSLEFKKEKIVKKEKKNFFITALCRNEEQLKTLLSLHVDEIYVTDDKLYRKYKSDGVILRLDRVKDKHEKYDQEKLLIGETGSLIYSKNNMVVTDYYLNVVNHYYVEYLASLGVKRITLSPELTLEQTKALMQYIGSNTEVELIVYGKLEYMIMKYNFINSMNLDSNNIYELEDKNKRRFPIFYDNNSHLMSNKKINLIDEISQYHDLGIKAFRIELFDEKMEEIKDVISKIRKSG